MNWPKQMPIVAVTWVDSNEGSGWQTARDAELTIEHAELDCQTVGWLLADREGSVSLAGSISATGSVLNVITIPRIAIKQIGVLIPQNGFDAQIDPQWLLRNREPTFDAVDVHSECSHGDRAQAGLDFAKAAATYLKTPHTDHP